MTEKVEWSRYKAERTLKMLEFAAARLEHVYGEPHDIDFLWAMRECADAIKDSIKEKEDVYG